MIDFDPGFHKPVDLEESAWNGREVTCDDMLPELVFRVVAFDHSRRWFQLFGPLNLEALPPRDDGDPREPEPDTFWVSCPVHPVRVLTPRLIAE